MNILNRIDNVLLIKLIIISNKNKKFYKKNSSNEFLIPNLFKK